jgi:arylsulfatase A-like enzyme
VAPVGCERAPVGPPAAWELAQRLTEGGPEQLLQVDVLARRSQVFTFRLDEEPEVRRWNLVELEPQNPREDSSRPFTLTGNDPRMARHFGFDADTVDEIVVEIETTRPGAVVLFWAKAGEVFTPQQKVAVHLEGATEAVVPVTFDVGQAATWNGTIDRLRLDPPGAPGQQVYVRSVTGLKRRTESEDVATWANRPVTVDLAGEALTAVGVPMGIPLTRRVAVPAKGRLVFSYGLLGTAPVPVTITLGSDRSPVPLFTAELPGDDATWHPVEVDLSPWGGEDLELRFETQAPLGGKPPAVLPLIANPRILRPLRKPPQRPNLILVLVDTLRADHLSLYGYPEPTTPRLDRWAQERAAVFLQTVAPAPWTIPSHLSLFTGLDPLHHGVNYEQPAPATLVTLAERLRDEGYATWAVTGGGYLGPRFGLVQGFDRVRHWNSRGERDRELPTHLGVASGWLRGLPERPFFLFLHTYEVHVPYRAALEGEPAPADWVPLLRQVQELTPENGYRARRRFVIRDFVQRTERLVEEDELALVPRIYDNGVRFMDQQIGGFLEALPELGLDRNTVVVFTSDHGESLGEKNLAGHCYLYDNNLLVPLLVALPDGRGAGLRIPHQVRLLDLAPTLLEALGFAAPEGLDGESLLPLLDGRPPTRQREAWSYALATNNGMAVRLGNRLKYMYSNSAWTPGAGEEQLFDLTRDPAEEHDLAATAPQLEELRRRAAERYRQGSRGVAVRLSNPGPLPFRLWLTSPGEVSPLRIKAVELPAAVPPLQWFGGAARVTVPAGESFEIVLDGFRRRPLELALFPPGEPFSRAAEVRFSFPAEEIEGKKRLAWVDGAWQAVPGDGPVTAPTFELERRGGAALSEPFRPLDSELLEQLRALGYAQ